MRSWMPLSLSLSLLAVAAPPALAAWPTNPAVNLPVCTQANDQFGPVIVSDGTGGAIITWYDSRGVSSGYDIYAQHVLSSGAADPAWPANGRALSSAANNQSLPAIVSDGAGGAIVAWADERSALTSDIYAQHVSGAGVVDPAWPLDGRALCTAAGNQLAVDLVSDGAGGAIATWTDSRGGAGDDIYAQHVLATGAVDPAWPADGQALCVQPNNQQAPKIASDGAGGAIVAWHDARGGGDQDIYAQHVKASGAVDPAWPANGKALCTALSTQLNPKILSDGAGGAIVTWEDARSGAFNVDIYAQHVLATGALDPAWPGNGVAVCTATGNQVAPGIVSDGSGGAVIGWSDSRLPCCADIYAQRVLSSGVVDPAWPADGQALCTAGDYQQYPTVCPDGAGGIIVTWQDYRGSSGDIYAGHVRKSGVVDPAWPINGRAACTAARDQYAPTIASDGAGGAIVTWLDSRSFNYDVYAQGVSGNGALGGPLVGVGDRGPVDGVSFAAPSPNPAFGAATLRFALPAASQVRLAVYDAAGRLVRELVNGPIAAGAHSERWNLQDSGGSAASAGLYFARLEAAGQILVRRMAVVR